MPSGRARFTWRGAEFKREVDEVVLQALGELRDEIERYLQANLHRLTNDMANKSFAIVDISGRTSLRRRLVIGSTSTHAVYHEKGWVRRSKTDEGTVVASFEGHPQFQQAMQMYAPQVTQRLRAAARARGIA